MKLVMGLPTRGRPDLLLQTLTTMAANRALPDTVIMVQVDHDDAETIKLAERISSKRVLCDIRQREDTIAGKVNRAREIPADAYMVGADDDPPVTPAWDAKMVEALARFPDGIGASYGHMANASFPGKYAFTAKLVDMLGYIQPEYFPYWFTDHWTDDLLRIIGRISFADVQSDQSRAGKTQEMREPGWWATWFDAAYLKRRAEAHAIINSKDFSAPKWLKSVLLTHHPLIEYRSRWINDNVRRQNAQYEQWSGLSHADERYQRVRKRAVDMIPHLLDGMATAEASLFRNALVPPTNVIGLKKAYA